jgi:hypothetical protein
VISFLDTALRFSAAVFLTYTGAAKLGSPMPFRQTLAALRLPAIPILAVGVPVLEFAAAAGLVVAPRSVATAVLVAGLGLAFAGAALLALSRGDEVKCACYGKASEKLLGVRQLVMLPGWLLLAVVSLIGPTDALSGVKYLSALNCALAAVIAIALVRPASVRNRAYLKTVRH